MGQLGGRQYEPLTAKDDQETAKPAAEQPPGAPEQWPGVLTGAGQFEYQGYNTWTPEEQQKYRDGTLKSKWAFGQVSIRLPLDGPVAFIAIVYGYLPFIIPGWWAIWLIYSACVGHPAFFPLAGLVIAGSFALVNEAITKKLCKKLLPAEITSRPAESVCKHPGMPSGHVMNAYTLMVWCLLECALDEVVHPEWLVAIALVMAPVPWARVYNMDHTPLQVAVSMAVASIMGCIAYIIRKRHFPHHRQPWDEYFMKSMEVKERWR